MSPFVRLTAFCAVLAGAQAAFTQVKLALPLTGFEPVISNKTTNFHYNKHYAGYVTKLNAAFGSRKAPSSLTEVIRSVAKSGTPNATALQRQGGGAWNHALWFKTITAPDSPPTKEAALSPALAAALKKAFGSFAAAKKNVSDAGTALFGSGFVWLCVEKGGGLLVVTTANQDNPLMGKEVTKAPECTPILGLDVWEHSYYLDYGPARPEFVDAFWRIVNWGQVSRNYASVLSGKPEELVA